MILGLKTSVRIKGFAGLGVGFCGVIVCSGRAASFLTVLYDVVVAAPFVLDAACQNRALLRFSTNHIWFVPMVSSRLCGRP